MSKRIKKHVELDSDNVEWLQSMYPKQLYNIMDLLLAKFREQHTKTKEDYAVQGAMELKRMLEDGAT